ncbi:MAG: 1-acyl-sn-glycerol-3-phosphate acyltransferase, partial [Actinobacteria bacterium]|nr:1-acyl-sn-glycerol-3-phosphate acyltransferase [Actinomycetota bacterium]
TKDRPRNLQRRLVIDVAYGEPIPYRSNEEPQDVTDRLMGRTRSMVADLAERYPQRPAGADDRWWLPAHMGGTAPTESEALEMTARDIAARRAQRAAEDI